MPEIQASGTQEEQLLFRDVDQHYMLAKEDLEIRTADFDKKDILFRSHIDEKKWPYRSLVFDPRIFTALYEKTSRTFANKPRGRMLPREGGDVLKATINNEILNFQWDDNERADGATMLSKWAMMDLNTRKYGASFAVCKWKYTKKTKKIEKDGKTTGKSVVYFDGPNFEPINNRDCLPNPSYPTIKNWFQVRTYPTFQELRGTNDTARSKPIYKNLDILKQSLDKESTNGGDGHAGNYIIKNKTIKGLTDYLGRDMVFKTIEVVTEYREDRWITFAPKYGVILRDIPNPYDHGQIPVVILKYYPIDDDLYGLSEIEPVEKIQRAINALVCQYLDAINMSLYAPLKVRSTGGAVQMHTLEFGPGKKWLMNDPSSDVLTHDQNISGVQEFTSTYRFLVGAMQEALGETSAATSNMVPGELGKTATEIKDLAGSRGSRDNFNQIFLADAMKKQMMFWHMMNKQFMFSNESQQQKIIQIAGKDAIQFFQKMGLDAMGLSDDAQTMMSDPDVAETSVQPSDLETPIFPVQTLEGMMPKMKMDDNGQVGSLIVEPDDLAGNYDYIPDVGSMASNADDASIRSKTEAIAMAINPQAQQLLMAEGYRPKLKDLLVDHYEDIGFKNADQYFEKINQGGLDGQGQGGIQPQPAGGAGVQAGGAGMANGGVQGVQGGFQAFSGGQTQPGVSRPISL